MNHLGAPQDLPRTWILVSTAVLIYWLVPQSMRMLFSVRLNALGASDLVIGVVVAGAALASLVLAVPSGYLLDRLDARLTLFLSMATLAAVTGLFALTSSVIGMAVLMLAQAVLGMWVWLTLQAGITRVGGHTGGQWHLNLFSLAWGLGMAVGPTATAWVYDSWSFQALCLLGAAFTLAGAFAVLFTPLKGASQGRDGDSKDDRSGGFLAALRKSLKDPVLVPVMVASFISLFVLSLRLSFYPIFLEEDGVPLKVIGVLMSVIGVASLAIRLVLPFGIRALGNRRILVWSTWMGVIGITMTPLSPHLLPLVVGALLIGISLGTNPVITLNLLADSSRGAPGMAMGLRLVANRAGQVTQPLVFGAVAAISSLAVAFPISGVLLGLTTFWMARRLRRTG